MSPESEDRARSHHLEVTRTARVWSLGDPHPRHRSSLWVVCHGYRQLAGRFIGRFTGVAETGKTVVAPEGLSRFYLDPGGGAHGPEARIGATWMTREDREAEIHDYVRYLDAVVDRWTGRAADADDWTGRPEQGGPTVLGFSQGCHTACRWVALGRTRPARLVLWGALLPVDPPLSDYAMRLAAAEVVLVRGMDDPWAKDTAFRGCADRLGAAGVSTRVLTYDGGHRVDPGLVAELAAEIRTPRRT